MSIPTIINYRDQKDSSNGVKSTKGGGKTFEYKPSPKDSPVRRKIWDRYNEMKDDPLRKEAQKQWDLGMKMYRMWAPDRDARDWRADIILPDGFSAVQAHLQETINIRPRPIVKGVEANDAPLENFMSSVFNYALDTTDFDQETHKARTMSAIAGTAFTLEEYRYETRDVQFPSDVEDGKVTYKKKTIVDWDDVYTRHIDNENAFFDPGASDQKYGQDCAVRDVIPFDVFKAMYLNKEGFDNTEEVVAAGSLPGNLGFFKMANDIEKNDVELIHYWNKYDDTYGVLANNVLIRNTPLPSTHKELPMDIWTFYPIPGQVYGMGIPFIIYSLVEERRSIRNMSLDRQKMQIGKMFLVNDLFDITEEDLTPRPHGLIKLNTNGLPLSQAVLPLEYGDLPGSSVAMDDKLLEDERRAHGMDDRPASQQGGTATEAAIVKEAAQSRINLINTLSNWNTLVRLGRKKLANVQFYYSAKRMEKVTEDGETKDMKTYRTIRVKGMEYEVKGDPKAGETIQLVTKDIPGYSSFKLEPGYSQFMDRNYQIQMDAESTPAISQAIKRAQTTEYFTAVSANPLFMRFLDIESILERMTEINGEDPKTWLLSNGMTQDQQRLQAQIENEIFIEMETSGKLFALPGTPHATQPHNEVHLDFIQTQAFAALSEPVQKLVMNHIQEEIQGNPELQAAAASRAGQPDPNAGGNNGGGGDAVVPAPGNNGGANPADPTVGAAPIAGGDVTAGNVTPM